MIDFQKIFEMSVLVFDLDQVIVFDNGTVVDKDNFGEYINSRYDA